MVKANVDKILDYLRVNKKASLGELSKKLGLPKKDLEKSAEYLEQDGVVKIDKGFSGTSVALIKDPEQKKQTKEELSEPPKIQQPQQPTQKQNLPVPPQPKQQGLPEPPKTGQPQQLNQNQEMPSLPVQKKPENAKTEDNKDMPPPPIPSKETKKPAQKKEDIPPPPLPNEKQKVKSETTPQLPKPDSSEAQQPVLPQKTETPSAQKINKGKNPSFLLDEGKTSDEPFKLKPQEPVMQSPPPKQTSPSLTDNADPLETPPPDFKMDAPQPLPRTTMPQTSQPTSFQQPLQKNEPIQETPITQPDESSSKYHFPEYAQSTIDKLDYLIEQANKKIDMHDYDNVNVLYRKIYDIYQNSDDITPNERYFIGEKVKELFDRIKRVYIIEHVT